MVPSAVAGGGRRAADLQGHAPHVARKARGLEAALVDKSGRTIAALDLIDTRSFVVAVAGPAALLTSKLHKLHERLTQAAPYRLDAKDALDILRLLRSTPTEQLARTFLRLQQAEVSRRRDDRGSDQTRGTLRERPRTWTPNGRHRSWSSC